MAYFSSPDLQRTTNGRKKIILNRKDSFSRTVEEHKNEFWRNKCWFALQKKRTESKGLACFEVLNQFNRYARWEEKCLTKVDWKIFYEEITGKSTFKEELIKKWGSHPLTFVIGFLLLFVLIYLILLCL